MSLANYLEEEVLDTYLRAGTATVPTETYLAIFDDTATAAELEAGTLTNEITGYTGDRPQVDNVLTAASQNESDEAEVTTNADIDYEDMPATTVQWAAVMDAATGGNVLAYAQSTDDGGAGTAVSSGATFRIASGDFTFTLT